MGKVAIHPPKTPITSGFNKGTAKNTIPNVCKMPGPPAPFVPTPLPNIAKSNISPKNFSKKVKIEGATVAIMGATFASMGDIASKATGGGLLSMNTHGPAKFIIPGSFTVQIEGKMTHLLGDIMLNNVGPAGAPPNTGATMSGADRGDASIETINAIVKAIVCECNRQVKQAPPGKKQKTCAQLGTEKHECCEKAIAAKNHPQIEGEKGYGKAPKFEPITGMTRTQAHRAGVGKGTSWPDCTVADENGNKQLVDFKFKCPPDTPTRKKKKGGHFWLKTAAKSPGKWPGWTKYKDGTTQQDKYRALGKAQKPPITKKPRIVTNKGCKT